MAASAQAAGEADREARQGILPVPDFSGDLWDRNYLTGDWAGTRDEWAAKGIQFDAEYYHYVQDVADGGVCTSLIMRVTGVYKTVGSPHFDAGTGRGGRSAQHYRDLRVSAFEEWSRAVA